MRASAVLAVLGVVLGAWYMLGLFLRVFFGPLREPAAVRHGSSSHGPIRDLCWREIVALAPLAVFVVWIGVQPKFFLDRMAPTLNRVTAVAERKITEGAERGGRADAVAVETRTRVR
jgi:NADH-quinone oxidoreductase subunit M